MPAPRKKISYQEFLHREYGFFRAPLAPEMDFYETIRSGNLRKLHTLLTEPFHAKKGLGILSDNPLQNLKYHLTITIALVARFCISGGLSVYLLLISILQYQHELFLVLCGSLILLTPHPSDPIDNHND